jgi:hypothetical protein
LVIAALTLLSAIGLCSCGNSTRSETAPSEIVIPSGATVTGPSNEGVLRVTAVTSTKRKYEWGQRTITLDLWPRAYRWYGSLGMELPTLPPWGGGGLSHVVLNESQLHFHSAAAVIKDLVAWNTDLPEVPHFATYWTADGLVVQFHFERARDFLALEAWVAQYCINGEKPKNLPGATSAVTLRDATGQRVSTLPCAHVDEKAYYDTWPKGKGKRD